MGLLSLGSKLSKVSKKLRDIDLSDVDVPAVDNFNSNTAVILSEKLDNVDASKASILLDSESAIDDWQAANKIPENKRQKNKDVSRQAAEDLYQGDITSKEARNIIADELPITTLYTKETMPPVPTLTEIAGSLGKKVMKHGVVGVKGFDIPAGTRVGSRLDIPAYNNYNKWVVSIHDGKNDVKGGVLGYGQAVRLKNVKFGSESQDALDIARGKARLRGSKKDTDAVEKPMGKATIARIYGDYVPEDSIKLRKKAMSLLDDPEWTQIGMNPYRQSQFYDKVTGLPIFEALEVIQIGPLALARGIKKPTISQLKSLAVRTKDGKLRFFNRGGAVTMNNQMQQFAEGGLNDEGGEIDEVSGNEVPIGGTKEGVRDDIPANVSEGEFIFPADVVRFIGLDKLMSIRQDAKMGLKKMEAMGQMGNGDEATMPDDMPFGMEDLMVVSSDDAPMEFAVGGFVPVENYTKVQDMISDKAEKSSVPKTNEDMQPQNFAPGGVVGNMAGQLANATASNVDTSAATKAPANTTFDNPTTGQEAFIDDGGPELRRPSIPRTPSEQRFLDTADVPTTDSNEVIDYDSYMNGVVTEVREYRDAEGNVTLITFINGVPTSPIPENFTLYVPPEDEAVADGTPAAIAAVINNNKDDNDSRQVNTAPTPINYAEMGDAEFAERMEYENGKGYQTQKFLGLAISSLIPLGGMFAYGSMRSHARKSEQRLNSMIRNAGTAEEASRLTSIRDGVLKNAKLKSTEESGALGTWVDSWLLGQGYTKDQAVTGASSVTVVAKQGLDVIEPDNNIAAQNLQVAAQNEEERLGIDPPAEVEAQQTSDDVGASATPEQLAKQNENKSSDDTLDPRGREQRATPKAKSVVSQEDMGDVSDRMLQPRTPEGSASSGTAPSEGIPAELKSEKPSTEPTVPFYKNKKMFGVNSAFGNVFKSMLGDNFKDKDEVASVAPRNLPPQEDMSNVSDRMTQPAKTFVPEGFDYNQATSDQQGAGATSSQLAAQADPDRFDPRGREQRATPKVQSAFTGATMDTVEQTASAFDQGVPRSPAPETFDQAFKRNKAAGRTAFTFSDGKSYTTETVEERKAKPALPSSASTASNTLYQTAANLLTPGDGKSYEGGVLKNEANKRVNTLYQNTANAFTKNDGRSYVDGVLIDDVTKKPYVEKGSKGNSTPDPSVYGYTGSDEKGNAIGKVSDGRTSGVLADNDGKVIRDSKNRTIYVDEEGNQYVKTDLLGIGREAVKAPVQVNKEDKDPPVVAKPKPVVKTGDGGVTAAKKIVATQNSQSKQDKSDERAAARAATKTTKASTKEYKTQKETKAATDKAVEKYGRATGARAKGGLINRPKAKAKTTNKRGLAARK